MARDHKLLTRNASRVGISKKTSRCPIKVWHVLSLIALAVQAYVFGPRQHRLVTWKDSEQRHGQTFTEYSSPGRSILEHTDETEGVGELTGVPSHVDKRGNDTSAPPANYKSTESMPQLIEPSEGRWHDFQTFNTCELARLGGREKDGYGAWVACVNLVPTGGGLAYSFGVGGDVSYDNDLVERGLTVHAFDPTINITKVERVFKGRHGKSVPEKFVFREIGIGAVDGVATFLQHKNQNVKSKTAVPMEKLTGRYVDGGFQAAVLRLKTLMCMNSHSWMDVLKMDVEGLELDICESHDFTHVKIPTNQLLIEFHERSMRGSAERKRACLANFKQNGFSVVHVSNSKQEYALARMSVGFKLSDPLKLQSRKALDSA